MVRVRVCAGAGGHMERVSGGQEGGVAWHWWRMREMCGLATAAGYMLPLGTSEWGQEGSVLPGFHGPKDVA